MKKIFFYLLLLILSATTSCDYISEPFPPSNANTGDTSACPSPSFPTITTHVKKILLEDYTGHACTNCPNAADKLHEIDTLNPGKIIAVAVHVGGFAAVPPSPFPVGAPSWSYTSDFRTIVGNTYDSFFKINAGGLPKGMINRLYYDATSSTQRKNWWEWSTVVNNIVNDAPVADIQIINEFDPAGKKLCTHVKTEFLTANTGTYNLVVLMLQDSIVAWQFDNGFNDSDYVHRHVLRDAINSTWGDEIAQGSVIANQTVIKKYAYNIPNDYNGIPTDMHHMHVVAFVYNTATYEVLQAEEEKVMH